MGGWRDPPERRGGYQPPGEIWAVERRPRGSGSRRGACPAGMRPHVVAKSAQLRFRLRRKLRPLPCTPRALPRPLRGLRRSASPHRAPRGGGPLLALPEKKTGRTRKGYTASVKRQGRQRLRSARSKRKGRLGALRCSGPPRDGGRWIGASADLAWPSGTLGSSAIPVVADPWRIVRTASGWSSHYLSFSSR